MWYNSGYYRGLPYVNVIYELVFKVRSKSYHWLLSAKSFTSTLYHYIHHQGRTRSDLKVVVAKYVYVENEGSTAATQANHHFPSSNYCEVYIYTFWSHQAV